MSQTLHAAVDALIAFVMRFTQTILSKQHLAELVRLDKRAFDFIQQASLTVTAVELPGGGSPGYSHFGHTKVPLYALGPALHPTRAWFRMMERFKQADPDWQRIEATRQAEASRRDKVRGQLGRLVAAPCADPRQCLSWCNEAIDRLSEHVRLSGRRWDNEYIAEAAWLADVIIDHARNLGADSSTVASLRDLSRAVVRRPLDSQAPAGTTLDMLRRLAEWCRGQQVEGAGMTGGERAEATGADREQLIQEMKPSVRLAYLAFAYAESKAGKRLEDREAHELLKEEGVPEGAGNRGELTDYHLPALVTWSRQLRDARNALGEQKYTRRAGRPHGKSIVKGDQIEHQQDSDQ
jgi:hypothetical protein